MMKQLRLDYPTSVLSRMLVVSASGYYAWVDRPPSKRAREEVRLELEIKAAHKRTRQTYGPERLQRDLAEHGVRVGIGRIKRIRKKFGIRCKQKRRFKATTQSRHRLSVAENVWASSERSTGPTQCGSQTSHMSPQMRAGCTWQATRTCLPERSWAMPWENG